MAEPKFHKEALLKKLDSVEAGVKKYEGKPGMNSFVWINKHVTPLRERIKKGETSSELAHAVDALKVVEPKV